MKAVPMKEVQVEQPRVPSYDVILRCQSFVAKGDDKEDSEEEEKSDGKTKCGGQLEIQTKLERERAAEEKENRELVKLMAKLELRLDADSELVSRSPMRTQEYQHCCKPYASRAFQGRTRAVEGERAEGGGRGGWPPGAGEVAGSIGIEAIEQWVNQCGRDPNFLQQFVDCIPRTCFKNEPEISNQYSYRCSRVNECSNVSSLFASPAQSPSEQNLTSPESVTSEENSLYSRPPNIPSLDSINIKVGGEEVTESGQRISPKVSLDLGHMQLLDIGGGTEGGEGGQDASSNIGTVMLKLAEDPYESAIDFNGFGRGGMGKGEEEECGNLESAVERDALNEKLDPRAKEDAWARISQVDLDLLGKGDKDGDTQLMILLLSEKKKISEYVYVIVERLLKENPAYLSLRNELNQDALYLAAFKLVWQPLVASYIAEALVRGKQDVNMKYDNGNTLIHCLAKQGDSHARVLERLLKLRRADRSPVFDVNKKNNRGYTPLHIACETHKRDAVHAYHTVRVLVENGADSTAKDYKDENTPLHTLINESCDVELLRILLNVEKKLRMGKPAPTTVANRQGNTALHLACGRNTLGLVHQKDVLALLLRHGAMIQTKNINGCVPSVLVDASRKQEIKTILHSYRQKY